MGPRGVLCRRVNADGVNLTVLLAPCLSAPCVCPAVGLSSRTFALDHLKFERLYFSSLCLSLGELVNVRLFLSVCVCCKSTDQR